MYHPKTVFTEDGYEDYRMHLRNIKNGLFYIENHLDDLHVGALDPEQAVEWYRIHNGFCKLLPLLKNGDNEAHES